MMTAGLQFEMKTCLTVRKTIQSISVAPSHRSRLSALNKNIHVLKKANWISKETSRRVESFKKIIKKKHFIFCYSWSSTSNKMFIEPTCCFLCSGINEDKHETNASGW